MKKALYRLYRPKNFSQIIGQDQIVSILRNQIQQGHLSHAYLFTGSRGTGKTSMAKVFASAVNCQNFDGQDPCQECPGCTASMDVVEIDAASNNSVDNIRELRENIAFMPGQGRYKIYIIDEVHMLSQGAFNALLKTLEEPPAHVIFILATTEPNKIPLTIQSRCQRFDFHRIEAEEIVSSLERILQDLQQPFQAEALFLIAQKSEGAMRDALSMLDKVLSSGPVTYEEALQALGETGYEDLGQVLEDLKSAQSVALLGWVDKVEKSGRDIRQVIQELLLYLRDVLLYISGAQKILQASAGQRSMLERNSKGLPISQVIAWIEGLSELEQAIKYAPLPRILAEAWLIRQATGVGEVSSSVGSAGIEQAFTELKERVAKLERTAAKASASPVSLAPAEKFMQEAPESAPGASQQRLRQKIEALQQAAKSAPSPKEMAADLGQKDPQLSAKAPAASPAPARWPDEETVLREFRGNVHKAADYFKAKRRPNIAAMLPMIEPVQFGKGKLFIELADAFSFLKETVNNPKDLRFISEGISEVLGYPVEIVFWEATQSPAQETDRTLQRLVEDLPGIPIHIQEELD